MAKTQSPYKPIPFLAFLVLLLFLFAELPLHAQGPANPELRITKIDDSTFPDVLVYVVGKNLGAEPGAIGMTLQENGINQGLTRNAMQDVGTNTAILVDASESIFDVGLTGNLRYVEVKNAINRLVDVRKTFSPATDRLAAYAPIKGEVIEPIKEFTQDHGAVRNSFYLWDPVRGIGTTPMYKLLFYALESFKNPSLEPAAQRSIVFFSDGQDPGDSLNVDDVIEQANAKNVAIHTVQLGGGSRGGRSNLERLALLTGGRFTTLSSESALDPLWDQVAAGRQQRLLGYRSKLAEKKEIVVAGQLSDGSLVKSDPGILETRYLQPVKVSIAEPQGTDVISRTGSSYLTPLDQLQPITLPTRLMLDWAGQKPRAIQRVEYIIDNGTQVDDQEPFDTFTLDIKNLDEGAHTLRVKVFDELADMAPAESLSYPFAVEKITPPDPTPTPGGGGGDGQEDWIVLAALLLSLLALLTAIFVLFRKPEVRERVTGVIKAATEPFFMDRSRKGQPQSRARLIVEEGDTGRAPIEISSQARIGRDPELVNVVFNDPRVSRYHCRIVEEGDSSFRIYDEGSSSGTYVNYEQIDIRGRVLQHHDLINVGPIGLRFEVIGESERTEPVSPPLYGTTHGAPDETEKFNMPHRR